MSVSRLLRNRSHTAPPLPLTVGGLLRLPSQPFYLSYVLVGGGLFSLLWIGFALAYQPLPQSNPAVQHRPRSVRDRTAESRRGFVSSSECQGCHASQYASWYRTYHRTMTQVVTPETVIAEMGEIRHPYSGERHVVERRGDEYWVGVPDLKSLKDSGAAGGPGEIAAEASLVWHQLVMSTGLHHYQLYWYPTGWGRELNMFPFVFLSGERRWLPRSSVFLTPPDLPEPHRVWNASCIKCHSTDGRPAYPLEYVEAVRRSGSSDSRTVAGPDTQMAEPGIACEACHGPAQEHVRTTQIPLSNRADWALWYAQYKNYKRGDGDQTIVNPKRLEAARSAQVCGQCHSVNFQRTIPRIASWLTDGPTYRAGEDLERWRVIVRPSSASQSPMVKRFMEIGRVELKQQFWPDNQLRVVGREYNGLIDSPCFQGGEFSCISCHSVHDGDPDDQLSSAMRGDQACLQCHESFRTDMSRHTHHQERSEGSRCYNCHMPHTSYGLLKASRSHTIGNPSVKESVEAGRPNACNSCHLDKTLAWTGEYLSEWYGLPEEELTEEQRSVAASLLWLLRGDAGQRALMAWSMGWQPAQEASGKDWLAPFLALTLNDPYDAVRYIAGRSLRSLPSYNDFSYNLLWPPEKRVQAGQRAVDLWVSRPDQTGPEILLEKDGALRLQDITRLIQQRDNRPVTLAE